MAKTKKQACAIAHKWFEEQAKLPVDSFLRHHAYDRDKRGRLFTIEYCPKSLKGERMCLITFYVLDDGSVEITEDQHHIAARAGEASEQRFHAALNTRTDATPEWFLRVRRGHRITDKRGIDAFAYVEFGEWGRRLRIPVQIKSSKGGVLPYLSKYPLCYQHDVPVIVVNPSWSDDQLRAHVYEVLGKIREERLKTGTRYTEFHTLLFVGHNGT